jgi:glyoxylase-like metal-dependent hydrolase (beta-lactamase superfamily II)
MKRPLQALLTTLFLGATLAAGPVPASHWDPGSADGSARPHTVIEQLACGPGTYILRENLRDTFEAPFMYLLVGNQRALLIDTGDIADPRIAPLAATVLGLLPDTGHGRLPLLVTHSHKHLDHRAADPQFQGLPGVELVLPDLDHVKARFGFSDWPKGAAQIDLGGRIVDVLPVPGHHAAHLLFYDRQTALVFSGDFLLPGRLLVDDRAAYQASAERIAAFVHDRPVSAVLGGHVEMDRAGQLFPWQSLYHPDERPLPLAKEDLLALPAALARFNGFYTHTGGFVIENTLHNLEAAGVALLVALAGLVYLGARWIRRWRRSR